MNAKEICEWTVAHKGCGNAVDYWIAYGAFGINLKQLKKCVESTL